MKIFTEKELAAHLQMSPWTIRAWRIKSGLPHFWIGKRVFYRLEAVENWVVQDELKRIPIGSDL